MYIPLAEREGEMVCVGVYPSCREREMVWVYIPLAEREMVWVYIPLAERERDGVGALSPAETMTVFVNE